MSHGTGFEWSSGVYFVSFKQLYIPPFFMLDNAS